MIRPPVTVAVTGGAGHVGKRFSDAARARGYRLRHLTRRTDAGFHPDDEVRRFDMADAAHDAALLQGCDALVHLAAHIPRDHRDMAEAERCWAINAFGTLRLIAAAGEAGVRRIVQTTGANAYAPTALQPDEQAQMFPRSRTYYLGSKLLQEIYATEYCEAHHLSLCSLRIGAIYGPEQASGRLTIMTRDAVEGRPIRIVDGGCYGADMVHVDDAASALLLMLERDFEGPVNVGTGVRTTLATIAATLRDLTGAEVIDQPSEAGVSDTGFPALDITLLRSMGFAPVPVERGLAAMVCRFLSPALT
ncbi:MAG TPA: NAD(P)-dependent oxidoreductase [Sphingobium sp.]